MASIHKHITINRPAGHVWDAMRDVGALHTRLVVGFVTDCKLEGNVREVTFANGMKVKEEIIDVDDERRRVRVVSDAVATHQAFQRTAPVDAGSRRLCEVAAGRRNVRRASWRPGIVAMLDAGATAGHDPITIATCVERIRAAVETARALPFTIDADARAEKTCTAPRSQSTPRTPKATRGRRDRAVGAGPAHARDIALRS